MSTTAVAFMVLGVCTVTSWLFKIIDAIEKPAPGIETVVYIERRS